MSVIVLYVQFGTVKSGNKVIKWYLLDTFVRGLTTGADQTTGVDQTRERGLTTGHGK